MKQWRRVCLRAGLLAVTAMLLVAGIASANTLSANYQDAVLTWDDESQPLTFTTPIGEITCEVTIGGSFHELTMEKVANLLIGHATEPAINAPGCEGGSVTLITETLPWHLRYSAFTGTLPNITSLYAEVVGVGIVIEISGVDCVTEAGAVIAGTAVMNEEGVVTRFDVDAEVAVPIDDAGEGFFCDLAGSGAFSGSASMEDGNNWPIVIALI